MEADLYPRNRPDRAGLVDGAIGEGSSISTSSSATTRKALGPKRRPCRPGWQERVVRIDNANTNGVAGLCLEVHDLAISKYVAGRPKDLQYTRALAAHRLTEHTTLVERLRTTKMAKALRTAVRGRIEADSEGPLARRAAVRGVLNEPVRIKR